MKEVLEFLENFLLQIPSVIIFLSIVFLGLFIFWKGCIEKKKNISSVFDIFIISSVFAVIYSRVTYIIINWSEYSKLIWYWIPYEKYGDDIYLFRLLPWKYFSIWDGGLDIFSLVLGFMIMSTILSIFMKRWRWKDMFVQIYFSGITVFVMMYGYIGILIEKYAFLNVLGIVLLISILAFAISRVVLNSRLDPRWKNRVSEISSVLAIVGTSIYLAFVFLNKDLHVFENVNIYIFLIWVVVSIIYFWMDLRRANVSIESLSSVRNVGSIDVNQPVKINQ